MLVTVFLWTHLSHAESGKLCGPRSLLVWLHLSGKRVSLDDVLTAVRYRPGIAVSMLSLKAAAADYGLALEGLRISLEDYVSEELRGIVFLDGGHFATVVGHTTDAVALVDPPDSLAVEVSHDTLRRRWGGMVLVPKSSAEVLTPPATPTLADDL